jgi:hypothetical protein
LTDRATGGGSATGRGGLTEAVLQAEASTVDDVLEVEVVGVAVVVVDVAGASVRLVVDSCVGSAVRRVVDSCVDV